MCFVALESTCCANDLIVNVGGAVQAFSVSLLEFSKALEITIKWLISNSSKRQLFATKIILKYSYYVIPYLRAILVHLRQFFKSVSYL